MTNHAIPAMPEITANIVANTTTEQPNVPVAPPDADTSTEEFWGDLGNISVDEEFVQVAQPETEPATETEAPASPDAPAPSTDPMQLPEVPAPSVLTLQQQMEAMAQNVQSMQAKLQPPAQDMNTMAAQAVDYLTQTMYKLTPEQAEQLMTEPGQVMPKMVAQLHVNLTQQLGGMVSQAIQQQVGEGVRREMAAQKAESEFYGKYPGLKNPQFNGIVTNAIQAVRQVNPKASRTEVMDLAAAVAAQTLRQAGYGEVIKAPSNATQQRQAPYTPAAVVQPSAPQLQVPQQKQTIWEVMSQQEDNGDW